MKKLTAILIGLSLLTSSCFGVKVQMPSEQVLNEKLQNSSFQHFAEKTSLVRQLADKTFEALGIAMAVELSMNDYLPTVPRAAQMTTLMMKPLLIKLLLSNNPEAIQELESRKLL